MAHIRCRVALAYLVIANGLTTLWFWLVSDGWNRIKPGPAS
jgi:hypothetical protein